MRASPLGGQSLSFWLVSIMLLQVNSLTVSTNPMIGAVCLCTRPLHWSFTGTRYSVVHFTYQSVPDFVREKWDFYFGGVEPDTALEALILLPTPRTGGLAVEA